jgi:hypothetical protein
VAALFRRSDCIGRGGIIGGGFFATFELMIAGAKGPAF